MQKATATAAESSAGTTDAQSSADTARRFPGIDTGDFNALVKAARERHLGGKGIYKRALHTHDAKLYSQAFGILTDACDLAEMALEQKPSNKTVAKMVADISFLRYACFKHQVL